MPQRVVRYLTDDPDEWNLIDGGVWQSKLDPTAFSNDGGNTYYLTSEGAHNWNRQPLHKTGRSKIKE